MVDGIEAPRRDFMAKGLGPSEVGRGRICDSFHLTESTLVSPLARGMAV